MFHVILLDATANTTSIYNNLFLFLFFIIVFVFFFWLPKKEREKQAMQRNAFKKGDHVIVNGYLFGKIEGIKMGPANKKGIAVPESFMISLKPDNTVTIMVVAEAVSLDTSVAVSAQNKK